VGVGVVVILPLLLPDPTKLIGYDFTTVVAILLPPPDLMRDFDFDNIEYNNKRDMII
jgi:hypothetical protein